MEPQTAWLFRLPQELRDQIYDYALLEPDEICMKKPPRSPTFWRNTRRYRARLLQETCSDEDITFSTDAPIGKVNKQMRRELSDVLRRSALLVVARVRNFDFAHVIDYLEASGLQQHTVGADGMTSRRLVIEMIGPYDESWKANLTRWVEAVDELLPENVGELGGLHKSIRHSPRVATLHAPPEVLFGVSYMQAWPRGSGRKEVVKIANTLYARWRAEEAFSCPVPRELMAFLSVW